MLGDLKNGVIGNALGQVGGIGQQLGKSVAAAGKDIAKTASKQITGKQGGIEQEQKREKGEAPKAIQNNKTDSQEIVEALYGKSSRKQNPQQAAIQQIITKNPQMSPEDAQKLEALKQQLHKETYADEIISPQRKQAEEQAQEKQAKKQEEQEEMWKKEEKKRKEKEEEEALQRQKRPTAEKRPGAG